MCFEKRLNDYIETVNSKLDFYLEKQYPELIYEAMSYSVNAGGKRMRPVLLMSACSAFGGDVDRASYFACAIEMIHTYSLIHDDLPAMDNDDLRRGKLTCHKKFDEAMAILAGDALLNKAYEVMLANIHDEGCLKASAYIAEAAGTKGMIGGQVVDMLSEKTAADADTLLYIHKNKTGALISAALRAGAAIAGAGDIELEIIGKAGMNLGVAFQIKDDILDETSTNEILGKPVHSDEKNNKSTYITLFGMDKAKEDYEQLSVQAYNSVKDMVGDKFLAQYIKYIYDRKK